MTKHRHPDNQTTSKEILQFKDAVIELVEEYPCKSKEQLIRREIEIIQRTSNCINKVNTIRDEDSYSDYIIFQDANCFVVLSEKERTCKTIIKRTPVDAPPPNTRVLTPSNLVSAIREYNYDIRRKHKKYYQRKEARLAESVTA